VPLSTLLILPLTLAALHPLPEGEGKAWAIPSPPGKELDLSYSLSPWKRARFKLFPLPLGEG